MLRQWYRPMPGGRDPRTILSLSLFPVVAGSLAELALESAGERWQVVVAARH